MSDQEILSVQIEHDVGHRPGRGYVVRAQDSPLEIPQPIRRATRIEAFEKPGLHCNIPYVRVWLDDEILGEFCQHNIVGIYYETAETASDRHRAEEESRP